MEHDSSATRMTVTHLTIDHRTGPADFKRECPRDTQQRGEGMISSRHPEEDHLREALAAAHRVLYHQGLVDYLGHCSVRVPGTDRVLIKPKHSPEVRGLGGMRPEDMVVIDLDGDLVEAGAAGDSEGPPAERFIHTEIYRARPDVSAVVHTHQPAGTLLGVIGAELLPVLHVPSVLADGGHIGTWPCPLLVTSPDLGRRLAAALSG